MIDVGSGPHIPRGEVVRLKGLLLKYHQAVTRSLSRVRAAVWNCLLNDNG